MGDPPKYLPCQAEGYVRHLGHKFSPLIHNNVNKGLPITANADVVGPTGGFGWLLKLNKGAPRNIRLEEIAVDPGSTLLLSIAYPVGTTFTISAESEWCWDDSDYTCREEFHAVSSKEQVRDGLGNTYHVDSEGVLTFRVFQLAEYFTGNPDWEFPTYNTPSRDGQGKAIPRFERNGVVLPVKTWGESFKVKADCMGSGAYCEGETATNFDPDVCKNGYTQVAYDKCCAEGNQSQCSFA